MNLKTKSLWVLGNRACSNTNILGLDSVVAWIHKPLLVLILALFLDSSAWSWATPQDQPPFKLPPSQEIRRLKSAIIYTDRGEVRLELFPEIAPWHVANFKYLADKGFYRRLRFHIRIPHYIIQTGDPTYTGRGGPGYYLPPEFSSRKHVAGVVGMARAPNTSNPERRSNGSQFYILLGAAPHMDSQYTIFAEVVEGMNIVQQLKKGDYIRDIVVFVRR